MRPRLLSFEQVHEIRTAGLTDAYFERLYKVPVRAIRYARIGYTWKSHPTPPDTKPRYPGGRYAGPKALR